MQITCLLLAIVFFSEEVTAVNTNSSLFVTFLLFFLLSSFVLIFHLLTIRRPGYLLPYLFCHFFIFDYEHNPLLSFIYFKLRNFCCKVDYLSVEILSVGWKALIRWIGSWITFFSIGFDHAVNVDNVNCFLVMFSLLNGSIN